MRLLILGGTGFYGRFMTDYAIERGYQVTLFHRGQRNPGQFPQTEELFGDRDSDLEPLQGRRWDAVIDTSGYVPRVVDKSASLLSNAADHYTFVSSISVYADPVASGADENAPLATTEDETTEEIMAAYGALKVLCERVVENRFPGRALLVRPGIIVGPRDHTDRFSYWPWRMAQGGEALAPGRPDRQVQLIDARDLARWTLDMIERGATGAYNATGPAYRLTMQAMLETCIQGTGGATHLTWVDEAFLLEQGVQPWKDLPFWLRQADNGILEVNITKAIEAGLTFRPVEDTARDTYADLRTLESMPNWGDDVGITPEREAQLLRAWHEH